MSILTKQQGSFIAHNVSWQLKLMFSRCFLDERVMCSCLGTTKITVKYTFYTFFNKIQLFTPPPPTQQ